MRPWVAHRPDGRLPVEGLVARVLFWGGLLSIAFVVLGLALYAGHGTPHVDALDLQRVPRPERHAHPREVFVSVGEVLRGLAARPIDPAATIAFGLVLLLMTPVLGVVAAIPAFLAAGDRRYAAIGTVILAMLALGALLTGGVG